MDKYYYEIYHEIYEFLCRLRSDGCETVPVDEMLYMLRLYRDKAFGFGEFDRKKP